MQKAMWVLLLLLSFARPLRSQDAGKSMEPLSWLVGGTWTADVPKAATPLKIETRYAWSDNHAFLRFTTHFVSEKQNAHRYDGQFYWDPEQKQFSLWYMEAEGGIYRGPITVAGDQIIFDFRGENFEGKMSDLRVTVTKKSNDLYHWHLMEKSGEAWKDLADLDYARTAGQ